MNNYKAYKLFDKKWATNIPYHWSISRLKSIFQLRKERNNPIKTEHILSLTAKQGVIPISEKTDVGGNKPKEDITLYNIAYKDDLLVNCMNVVSGAAGVSKYYGAISPVYYALYLRDYNNVWYYHYIFRLISFQRSLLGLGKGILMHESESGKLNTVRMRISMDYLGNVLLPIPPRDEQDQIVRFLDWKVSSINRLINIKKKEIKEIEALKKSLIDECVTHGLNPDVPMKDSGVKWLGKIPAHWGIAPLCAVAKEKSICNCTNLQLLSVYLDVGVVPFTEKTEKRTNATSKDLTKYQRVDPYDFVLNNQQAWRGSVGISFHTGIVSPAYIVLSMDNTLNSYFANFLFRSRALVDQYLVVSKGVGSIQRNIYWTTLKRVKFVIPPLEEQNDIVKYLENRLNKYDNFIERIKEEIALLNELKLRLISDVVTGKIDVRDVNIPTFDIVEEDIDEAELEDNKETDDSGEVEKYE